MARPPRAMLLDVEGTTTPLTFVSETLFPYARAQLRRFVEVRVAELEDVAAKLRAETAGEPGAPPWRDQAPVESVVEAAQWAMDRDRKTTGLKTLQGLVWEEGYRSGALRGEVYADVRPAFERWRREGRRIAIFSSGSVLAQKLIFGHSTAGDLSSLIDAYFDTTIGPKREPASYTAIAADLELPAGEILFASDAIAELDAARAAGLGTVLSLRPGVPVPHAPTHVTTPNFYAL